MVVILMGTTGSGKTTIGTLLARKLGWQFADADDFHPPGNIEKMKKGVPLDDADRVPWLQALRKRISQWLAANENAVLACSALKERYRWKLLVGPAQDSVKLVYLKGTQELFSKRVQKRKGHFAKANLLASQFADLEEPAGAIIADTSKSPNQIVAALIQQLGRS